MKIIKIDYKNPDSFIIRRVANIIKEGKLAVVPGDAVYTLVGDATNAESINKVNKVKRRDRKKAFNLGLYCLEDINKYGEFNNLIYKIQAAFPNEPFTFVVKRRPRVLPKYLNPGYKKLGFRIPFNRVTSTLSKFNRTPVIGTSANISEFKNIYSVEELLEYFRGIFGQGIKPDIILDAGKLPKRNPSTVVDISSKKVRVVRKGEIKTPELIEKINKLI